MTATALLICLFSIGIEEVMAKASEPYMASKVFQENYITKNGTIYRTADDGTQIAVRKHFSADFENVNQLKDLIGLKYLFTAFTLQSPRAATVKSYVQLRKNIMEGKESFRDNALLLSKAPNVYRGNRALKAYAVAKNSKIGTSKASLATELLHFVSGDNFWFSAWCFIPSGHRPFGLVDLESTWGSQYPGMRLVLSEEGYLWVELKSRNKVKYRQVHDKAVPLPLDKWVNLKLHFHLSEKDNEGRVRVWQDGDLIIDKYGKTLPNKETILNNLEIGITAHSFGEVPAMVYFDNITVSDKPIIDNK